MLEIEEEIGRRWHVGGGGYAFWGVAPRREEGGVKKREIHPHPQCSCWEPRSKAALRRLQS